MENRRIGEEKRRAIDKMLGWCVEKYKTSHFQGTEQTWRKYVKFLAEMRKKQFYSQEEQSTLNTIRFYYNNRKEKKSVYNNKERNQPNSDVTTYDYIDYLKLRQSSHNTQRNTHTPSHTRESAIKELHTLYKKTIGNSSRSGNSQYHR